MAQYIEYSNVPRDYTSSNDYYKWPHVALLKKDVFIKEQTKWIEENVIGRWTTWFYKDTILNYGSSFCFEYELDAMTFKLRW